jgi:DNA adenine methylase
MRYLGGKCNIAKDIAEIVNVNPGNYLEPFMGACWVTKEIDKAVRLAGDIHGEIVHLFHELNNGWMPPSHMTKDEYNDIRSSRNTDKYPKHLTGFALAGCAHYGGWARTFAGEKYVEGAKNSLLRKKAKLSGVRFFVNDYKTILPKNHVIYCDPPYSNSYGYRINGKVGNGSFNTDEFWSIMREWSKNNLVFVSEQIGPSDFEVVYEKNVKSGVRIKDKCLVRTEKLFHMKPCEYDSDKPAVDNLNFLGA